VGKRLIRFPFFFLSPLRMTPGHALFTPLLVSSVLLSPVPPPHQPPVPSSPLGSGTQYDIDSVSPLGELAVQGSRGLVLFIFHLPGQHNRGPTSRFFFPVGCPFFSFPTFIPSLRPLSFLLLSSRGLLVVLVFFRTDLPGPFILLLRGRPPPPVGRVLRCFFSGPRTTFHPKGPRS